MLARRCAAALTSARGPLPRRSISPLRTHLLTVADVTPASLAATTSGTSSSIDRRSFVKKSRSTKRTEQVVRAGIAKPPGYGEFVKALEAARRVAREKNIIKRQMWEAIHSVFGAKEE